MRLCTVILFLIACSAASAERVSVQAGDHDGFSRLVFYHQGKAPVVERLDEKGLALRFEQEVGSLDIGDVFYFISRDRVEQIALQGGQVKIDLACGCDVEGFVLREGVFVFDVFSQGRGGESDQPEAPTGDRGNESPPLRLDAGPSLNDRLGLQTSSQAPPYPKPDDREQYSNPDLLFTVSRFLGGHAQFEPFEGGPAQGGSDDSAAILVSRFTNTWPNGAAQTAQGDCESSYSIFLEDVDLLLLTPERGEEGRWPTVTSSGEIDQDSVLRYFTQFIMNTLFLEAEVVIDLFEREEWRLAAQDIVAAFSGRELSMTFQDGSVNACGRFAKLLGFLSASNGSDYQGEDVIDLLDYAALIETPVGDYMHQAVLERGEELGLLEEGDFTSKDAIGPGALLQEIERDRMDRPGEFSAEARLQQGAQGHVLAGSAPGDALFLDLVASLIESENIFGAWVELRQRLNATYVTPDTKRAASALVVDYLARDATAAELALMLSDARFGEFLGQLSVSSGTDWDRILKDRSDGFVLALRGGSDTVPDPPEMIEAAASPEAEDEAGGDDPAPVVRDEPPNPFAPAEEILRRSTAVLEESAALEAEIRALLE